MLQALDVADGMSTLEIGTVTGYNCALLCERLGDEHVASVEIDPALAEQARLNLDSVGYKPYLVVGDGADGVLEQAPFDRVLSAQLQECRTHSPARRGVRAGHRPR